MCVGVCPGRRGAEGDGREIFYLHAKLCNADAQCFKHKL